jgi:hypothetical protein
VQFKPAEIKAVLQTIAKYNTLFGVENNQEKNPAKQLASGLFGKSVWYAAAEHLAGNAHIAANQMNENAKRFAGYFLVPELNHHLMKGCCIRKRIKIILNSLFWNLFCMTAGYKKDTKLPRLFWIKIV